MASKKKILEKQKLRDEKMYNKVFHMSTKDLDQALETQRESIRNEVLNKSLSRLGHVFALALRTQLKNFGQERIFRVLDEVLEISEALERNLITLQDIEDVLKEEKINMEVFDEWVEKRNERNLNMGLTRSKLIRPSQP